MENNNKVQAGPSEPVRETFANIQELIDYAPPTTDRLRYHHNDDGSFSLVERGPSMVKQTNNDEKLK